jgi:hypothetical protein
MLLQFSYFRYSVNFLPRRFPGYLKLIKVIFLENIGWPLIRVVFFFYFTQITIMDNYGGFKSTYFNFQNKNCQHMIAFLREFKNKIMEQYLDNIIAIHFCND